MEALTFLKAEHSALLDEVYQLDQQLALLESSGPIKGARLLKQFAGSSRQLGKNLEQHTDKEEKSLFPILEAKLGNDRELVEVMRHEHEELIEYLDSLIDELDRMDRERDTRRTWNLVSKLQDLKGFLTDHLSKEERLLFWLAEIRLSSLDQRRVASSLQISRDSFSSIHHDVTDGAS